MLYTPETVIVGPAPPLFRPHLAVTFAYGHRRGGEVRSRGIRALRRSTLLPVLLLGFLVLAPVALFAGGWIETSGCSRRSRTSRRGGGRRLFAAFSSRSLDVGGLVALGLVLTHVAYAAGFLRGLIAR